MVLFWNLITNSWFDLITWIKVYFVQMGNMSRENWGLWDDLHTRTIFLPCCKYVVSLLLSVNLVIVLWWSPEEVTLVGPFLPLCRVGSRCGCLCCSHQLQRVRHCDYEQAEINRRQEHLTQALQWVFTSCRVTFGKQMTEIIDTFLTKYSLMKRKSEQT